MTRQLKAAQEPQPSVESLMLENKQLRVALEAI